MVICVKTGGRTACPPYAMRNIGRDGWRQTPAGRQNGFDVVGGGGINKVGGVGMGKDQDRESTNKIE